MPLSTIFQLYRGGQFNWWRKKKSDSEFLSYNLMLNSGEKIRVVPFKENSSIRFVVL
jgi:hypothetical protein